MELAAYFQVWNKLTAEQQRSLETHSFRKSVTRGTVLHNGSADCSGLMAVVSGQLRAYILSGEGREITVYRLFERDMCLFSASCILSGVQFEIIIEAEKDTELWVIPPGIYRRIMEESAALSNYTNELMATRFTDVMWLIEQVMWKSQDKRLAAFLAEECALEETQVLKITHETIANHLGTAREVVTRMLRYFQGEGVVRLNRGTVEITDRKRLEEMSE